MSSWCVEEAAKLISASSMFHIHDTSVDCSSRLMLTLPSLYTSASLTSIKQDVVLATNEETLIMIWNDRTHWTLWSSACTTRRPSCKVARCAACERRTLFQSLNFSGDWADIFLQTFTTNCWDFVTSNSARNHESLSVIHDFWRHRDSWQPSLLILVCSEACRETAWPHSRTTSLVSP